MIPKDQADLLFTLSFLILITSIYAFSQKKYDIAIISFVAFLTSIAHWRDPKYGTIRNIDVIVIHFGYFYILLGAIILKIKSVLFWSCVLLVAILYYFGRVLYLNGYVWLSVIIHCAVHLFGNLMVALYCLG